MAIKLGIFLNLFGVNLNFFTYALDADFGSCDWLLFLIVIILTIVLRHSTICFVNYIIIIISGFGIYGAAVVPDSGVGNTWQRLTLVLHEFLSNGLTPSRLHIVISFLTHADHVFLGLPRFLVPGTPNRVMELM